MSEGGKRIIFGSSCNFVHCCHFQLRTWSLCE